MENMDEIVKQTLEHLKSMIDIDNVIGKPIINGDGTVILPVSKVSCGFVSGGGEYEQGKSTKDIMLPHAVAGAGGVTVTPLGFLVCGREKKFLSVDKQPENKWTELAKAAFNALKKDED